MIPNYWYPILSSHTLKPGKPVGITRFGKRMVLWRSADRNRGVTCLPDRCSHRSALLSRGKIRNGCLECPYHGLRFDPAGRCVLIPANGADAPVPQGFDIAPVEVREKHGVIWYWYGDSPSSAEVPWFEQARDEGDRTTAYTMAVDLPFFRVMENLYDLHHLPFVHRWTIPGAGPRLEDYKAEADGELIRFSTSYRYEGPPSWTRPRFSLSAVGRFPSMMLIEEFPGVQFHAAVTPIDDHRSWIWARYHQAYVPGWLGGKLLARLIAAYDFGLVFRMQDRPTLQSQLDPAGDLSAYNLFHADRAIGLYFGMVRRAMRERQAGASEFAIAAVGGR